MQAVKKFTKGPVSWLFHSLVEVCFLHSLLAPLQCCAVLVLQGLQVCHRLHALQLQTLIVMTCFRVWSISHKKGKKKADKIEFQDSPWRGGRRESEINIIQTLCSQEHRGREASLKLYAYLVFYRVEHSFKQICVT